ncbi:MAG: OmpA family protein [Acidobacteria bacterium]|nr:OmpA family protein [Acidobacteriota bacterium]MDA1234646.1 OmpA family protein [Acidobacteriota bacterium]
MISKRKIALATLNISLALFAAGCKKEVPPQPPPPPPAPVQAPAPARPTVTISAEPSSIERGKSATLRWSSSNATSASLNQGIGTVPASGSREIFPTNTTSYTIEVTGAGGNATASVEVVVRAPPPPPPPPPARDDFSTALRRSVNDTYYDYDKYDVRPDAEPVLRANASALKDLFASYANGRVLVEGHCDERGSNEYNLALGDRRASAARDFLVTLGVSAGKLSTVSYGEERPQCTTADESCWQRNRRAHFAVAP